MRKLLLTALGGTLLLTVLAVQHSLTGGMPPALAQGASADYFLKLEGIEGESLDSKHKGEIEINSWSWGANQTAGLSTGGGAGKVSVNDFHFRKTVDKATPLLMQALTSGRRIPTAVLTVRKAGSNPVEYYKITLKDALITSFQTAGDGGLPTDSFSLNFARVELEYTPQNADGSLGTPLKAGYDVKTIKK